MKNKSGLWPKPCPFCGGNKVSSGSIIIHKDGNTLESVWCDECDARVTAPKGHPEHAWEQWNKRVLDVSSDELIDLEKLLKYAIYKKMKEYTDSYEDNKHVCCHKDILPMFILDIQRACNIMAKMDNLNFSVMMEKNNNEVKE